MRRARARAGLITLIALTVALIVGALAGTRAWLATPAEDALHADAAAALGLAVGDTIGVAVEDTSRALTIVGTWRPTDHPHWAAEPLAATGADPLEPDAHGPATETLGLHALPSADGPGGPGGRAARRPGPARGAA